MPDDRSRIEIYRDQLYYWTPPWQEAIAESRAALAAGDYVEFDSDDPDDVIRWLYNTEEA